MPSASRDLSARARAIVDAAEQTARGGGRRLPEGLPVTAPRRTPARPVLRAVEAPAVPLASERVAAPLTPPAPTPAAVQDIPDPARLLALIERVALQAAEIRRRLDLLSAAVDRAEADLGAGPAQAPAAPVEAPAPAPQAAVPPTAPAPAAPAPAAPASATQPGDAARLVAIEMAVAGASRLEVRDRLTNEYGVEDVTTLLDSVFGRDIGDHGRMPWR